MPKGTRPIDPDLAVIADSMEHIMWALGRLTAPTTRSVFKVNSLNGEVDRCQTIVKRFEEVTEENGWTDRKTLQHLLG